MELLCRTYKQTELADLANHLLNKTYMFTWENKELRWDRERAQEVLKKSAAFAERQAQPKHAINLYRFADDYVQAVRVLNGQLCSALETTRSGRDAWIAEAHSFTALR